MAVHVSCPHAPRRFAGWQQRAEKAFGLQRLAATSEGCSRLSLLQAGRLSADAAFTATARLLLKKQAAAGS